MRKTEEITTGNATYDVRDVIARIEHLEQLEQPGPVDMGDDNDAAQDDLFAELALLRDLLANLKGYGGDEQWRGDWYPITLIHNSEFEAHARELAEDCGMVKSDASWPHTCIDWKQAARELRMDYTSVEFGADTYWYR